MASSSASSPQKGKDCSPDRPAHLDNDDIDDDITACVLNIDNNASLDDSVAQAASVSDTQPQTVSDDHDNDTTNSIGTATGPAAPSTQPLTRASSFVSLGTMVTTGVGAETPATQVRSNAVEHARRSYFVKFLLYLEILMWAAQIVAVIVVLALHWDRNDCDTPLQVWCLVVGIRNAFAIVFKIAKYKRPDNIQIRRFHAVLEVTLLVWFIVGNYWLFDSPGCEGSAVYILALCLVIFSYIYLLIPFMLCLSLVFCLPFVLLAIRLMKNNNGVSDGVIKRKTVRTKFKYGMYDKADASCCICLNDYVDGVRLSTLPCDHHFHRKCVDAWLRINQSCPLCKRLLIEVEPNTEVGP
ncbi:hypothetical protein SARC_04772 [Sphaeroforma arctica JP610]|uniref:RING-type domain-containing protein n=1 Tax=Sphaeroforma arctica JP610 TaxID=667725 RepID=A0A0L0G1I5_9EUKA|nr:hypothetical protein SARC_04772 [Sphaeroforma arctica JP610]KNC82950.1 hypothetical protein SARC_04772 [Sphaeroforma arctica JP610]|eukprot:XP_014156852.1 hypothetical protein SARC_04772 [Sphaeroforma arctica JP610]